MQSFWQYRQMGERLRIRQADESFFRIMPSKNPTKEEVERHQMPDEDASGAESSMSEDEKKELPLLVEWEGSSDPINPRNWSMSRRITVFAILWINVFAVDWASSTDSQAGKKIAKQFHVSEEAESLSPALYTFGLAAGSVFAGPISETTGRNPVYVVSRCFHVIWLLGAALAPNFGGQCVFRLFAGLNGSIILAIHAASIADIFGPLHRTLAWPLIALASFFGTSFAPVVGAWIAQSSTISWRWTDWIAVILSGSTLFLTVFLLPETFSPILLRWKAHHLRTITGNNRYMAQLDFQASILHRFKVALRRALHMLTKEPIVALLGAWLVVEYIVVFGFLQGFTFIFTDTFNFSKGITGTCFVGIAVGTMIWTAGVPVYYIFYKRKVAQIHAQHADNPDFQHEKMVSATIPGVDLPHPEYRLWQSVLAAPAFPISLFWLGWTNYSSISPWSNIGAVTLLGFSWAGIYVTVYQYILDVYGIYAGSALAIITCWRYAASGAVSLFARPMYKGIGIHWTSTLLGCLAVLLMPAPWIFYKYGPGIRAKSSFAGRYSRPANQRLRTGRAAGWE